MIIFVLLEGIGNINFLYFLDNQKYVSLNICVMFFLISFSNSINENN